MEPNENIFYQLSYSELGERHIYLNGTSWVNKKDAESEFLLIRESVVKKELQHIQNLRIDWQLEMIRNGKRSIVKMLNILGREKVFDPKCGNDFYICSSNSDSNCFRKRQSYCKAAVKNNQSICDLCVYNQ